jgi:hypothetical protein
VGLDPGQDTPGRAVIRFKGSSLVQAMELALKDGGPAAGELVAAESVVEAETKDHQNWELIGEVAKQLDGDAAAAPSEAYGQVEKEEGAAPVSPAPVSGDGLGSRAVDRVARRAGRDPATGGSEESHQRDRRRASPKSQPSTSHLQTSLEMPSVTLRTATSGGFASATTLDVVVWLARKDSNLRSPDPEISDPNQLRQLFTELSPAVHAV